MNRACLPFRAVNRRGEAGYQPELQRHHLLPRQLLVRRSFAAMFERIGRARLGFDDFRRNGLLLPASEAAHCAPACRCTAARIASITRW